MPDLPFAAYIFDLDGTLTDSMSCHAECWTALFQDQGLPITLAEYRAQEPGGKAEEVVRQFLPGRADGDVACLVEQKEFLYRTVYRPRLELLPGARALLEQARREGVRLALATSAGIKNMRYALRGMGIEECFDALVCADDVLRGKPDPEAFLVAARRLGVEPGRCLVFEDSGSGLDAARAAGMRSVAIATTRAEADLARHPAVLVTARDYRGLDMARLVALASLDPAARDGGNA